jgi:hypothetical protein
MCDVLNLQAHHSFDSHAESPVENSQAPGVGRLGFIGGFLLVNNLGRNISVLRYSSGELNCVAKYAETVYPDDDEASQFDLDMHAFLRTSRGDIAAVSHYGRVRMFIGAFGGRSKVMQLITEFGLPGDVERLVMCGDCIIGSSPSGYKVPDAAETGVMITDSVYEQHEHRMVLSDWGMVNNVAVNEGRDRCAVVAGKRIGVFEMKCASSGIEIGTALHELEVPFISQLCTFTNNEQLFLAGYEPAAVGDQDWDALGGGGFAVVDMASGEIVKHHNFNADLAWGNGGVPAVVNRRQIFGVTRQGELFSWNVLDGERTQVAPPVVSAEQSLGIAHCAFDGMTLWAGFNRGGYNLHRYTV